MSADNWTICPACFAKAEKKSSERKKLASAALSTTAGASILARLAELEADRDRLDAVVVGEWTVKLAEASPTWMVTKGMMILGMGSTLREAIDQARGGVA